MKLTFAFSILMASFLGGCTPKVGDRSAAAADAESVTEDYQQLAPEVEKRVAAIYDDVFDHYNRGDFGDYLSDKYFSRTLKQLWDALPDDEEVIEADPWTGAQDFDRLSYAQIDVEMIAQDTAKATVMISLWKDDSHPIILSLVREEKDGGENWYVDDFRDGEDSDYPSLAEEIRNYIKESNQN